MYDSSRMDASFEVAPLEPILTGDYQLSHFRPIGHPGRLAPRWLEDFVNGNIHEDGSSVLSVGCTRGMSHRPFGGHFNRHELLIIPSQSPELPEPRDPNNFTEILSCLCRFCHYHFIFEIKAVGGTSCDNDNYPFHHIVYHSHQEAPNIGASTYRPTCGTVEYRCSAAPCTLRIVTEVSKPRLDPDLLLSVSDPVRIRYRMEQAAREDPERFGNLRPDMDKAAPRTLLAYMNDILGGEKKDRKIDFRNKTFYVQFGPDCDALFESLEFQRAEIGDNNYWLVPYVDPAFPNTPTPIGSRRAFFEDAKSEIQGLLETIPENQGTVAPNLALPRLKNALGCESFVRSGLSPDNWSAQDFETLGLPELIHESLFEYAFRAQRSTDPSNEVKYFQALQRLSGGRGYDSLQLFMAGYDSLVNDREARSQGQVDPTLAAALNYFNLSPYDTQSEDQIIAIYGVFCESSPGQRITHRNNLAVIGAAKESQKIMDVATQMDFNEALNYLEAHRESDPDTIAASASLMVEEKGPAMVPLIAHAMKVIAQEMQSDVLMQAASDLLATKSGQKTDQDSGVANIPAVNMDLPVGLENIRNTCYLNSILQYFFTVKPVLDIVLNWEDYKMKGDEYDLSRRRIGGTQQLLAPGDPLLAKEFILSLKELYQQLRSSQEQAVRPQQRLAIAALHNVGQLVERADKQSASSSGTQGKGQLPRQPSPHPPPLPDRPTEVTVKPVSEHFETSSTVSSQTLINDATMTPTMELDDPKPPVSHVQVAEINMDLGAYCEPFAAGDFTTQKLVDGDVVMSMADNIPDANESVECKILTALGDSSVSGTDQQDVEEVMGNIIEHLHAAIKPTGEDELTGAQMDKIMDTFYCTTVTNVKKSTETQFNRQMSADRWITAYPSLTGPIQLYDALNSSFDWELVDDTTQRYTSIVKLPPILHICIQRSTREGRKNMNTVAIPEILYMDRYMDHGTDSHLFEKRQRSWDIKSHLKRIEKMKPAEGAESDEDRVLDAFDAEVIESSQNGGDVLPSLPDDIVSLMASEGVAVRTSETQVPLVGTLEDGWVLVDAETVNLAARKPVEYATLEQTLRTELDHLFESKQYPYRLHAVICHAGSTGKAGHYWIWIHDFEKDLWRKYNDSIVTEYSRSEDVLNELSRNGDPYYVAYVRDQDKADLVGAPLRDLVPSPPMGDGDIEMEDVSDFTPDFTPVDRDGPPPIDRDRPPADLVAC